ncbi:tetratricopeptide repeat protein [Arthrobacter echini]|uniref:Tetratricopeptide repeat protein n=1 Tax=Arthrobacter echini TaxID=1529066 RepID=A0A5D0XWB6_9MICC|nr:tetratricopeptide repeat protein [Arthrobacter echini]TYD00292.1 tetratricopeptide repeat protein [Arthrobacter echini]
MSATPHIELDRILAARERDNMAPTIAALLRLHQEHPEDPRVLYEVGGAYDTAGEEATAAGFYERAMAAGLDGAVRQRGVSEIARRLGALTKQESVGKCTPHRNTGPRIEP